MRRQVLAIATFYNASVEVEAANENQRGERVNEKNYLLNTGSLLVLRKYFINLSLILKVKFL